MEINLRIHHLKTIQPYFEEVRLKKKPFELRINDRDFQIGDILVLDEFDIERGFTGQNEVRRVTYILHGGKYGLDDKYCIMGMEEYFI